MKIKVYKVVLKKKARNQGPTKARQKSTERQKRVATKALQAKRLKTKTSS